jgi:phage FluMu gp28-like protein
VRIISTPNGQGNYFHDLWLNSKAFARYKVTIHDAVSAGLPMDPEELRAAMPDAEAWAQEYECEFADQSSVLLPYDLIDACEAAEASETNSAEGLSRSFDATHHYGPELYVGIDFGRKQDLTVCWVLEKLPNNLTLTPNPRSPDSAAHSSPATKHTFITREVLVLQRMPTPEQIELLRPRVRLARRVCVDYTGAGVGLGDALAQEFGHARDQKDYTGRVECCTFTASLKEEIFVKLRAAMERRALWIPRSTEIREDLHAMHRIVSPHGFIAFRASRSADGHSDRCTALALAVRAAESSPVIAPATTVRKVDPYFRGTVY